ncbi:hypothetical protein [Castellaniella defragrans]|uniref:hypothetical protein n=1 Tax=Castellaniella defragrans TaxID=75697 RepID=UPI002AFED243|nr:hypothetical protein [Castellaniella defragrans]
MSASVLAPWPAVAQRLIAEWVGWRPTFALVLAVLFLAAGGLLLRPRAARPRDADRPPARPALLGILALPAARWLLAVTASKARSPSRRGLLPACCAPPRLALLAAAAAFSGRADSSTREWAGGLLRWIGESGRARLGGASLCRGFGLRLCAEPVWIPAACALAGFGFYCLHNTLQTNATQMAPAARGAAMALFACVLFLDNPWACWRQPGSPITCRTR